MPEAGRRLLTVLAGSALLASFPIIADARVTQFEVLATTSAYDGQTFGEVGTYERIDAVVHFAIDPTSERGQSIVDLDLAPANAHGEVEFSSEVVILRPSEAAATAPVLFYDVPNRGRNLVFTLLNRSGNAPATEFSISDPGDGFLMEQGYTIVWGGWQHGLPEGLLSIDLPVIPGLTDLSREEFIFDVEGETATVTLTYPAADLDPAAATLTVRQYADNPRETVEGLAFRYIDERTVEILRPESMDAGAIYEFIYPAKDAVPAGLAFAATSDLVSFLRGNPGHDIESPLTGIEHTIAIGISQSGRFLRDLIYQGFNADEQNSRVFDGAIPHIAGSRKTFTNARFAQPGRYSRQHEDHDFSGDQFPFTYVETQDPFSGRSESILSACTASATCPRVMHTDTSAEYWQARASLVSTTPIGEAVELPEAVRLYMLSGAPHFTAWGSTSSSLEVCVNDSNPLSVAPSMRALTLAMENWLREDALPPVSTYPTVTAGTLVAADAVEWPRIEGASSKPSPNALLLRDHSQIPPAPGGTYSVLVPEVNEDGIAQGGVAEALVAAPLGSYLGWNLRAKGFAEGALCGLAGSFVPFPASATEGDSRLPIDARYEGRDGYVTAVREAAEDLVGRGLMLKNDIHFVVEAAKEAWNQAGY